MRTRLAKLAAILVPVALLVFLGWRLIGTGYPLIGTAHPLIGTAHPSPTIPALPRKTVTVCNAKCRYTGVALPAMSEASLNAFIQASGSRPGIEESYQAFGHPFPTSWARELLSRKILPLIQIDPRHASLTAIAAGQYDKYLTSYGHAVRALGKFSVALSFAHEQNGGWYPWGCHHVPPSIFIAAYRHVETVIRHAGARHVIWVWTANVASGAPCPMMARWPGKAYVTWIGIDGYLRTPGSTYHQVFGTSLTQVAGFGKPVLLSEVGVLIGPPGAPSRIRQLYRGAASSSGVIGVVYFDSQTGKLGNYRPQDNPAVLAAFRQATAHYGKG
jgi:mannan endo-1,4-beta-mannosidase